MRFFLTLAIALFLPAAVMAQEAAITFKSPIRCTFGTNCWVMNYVDRTPDGDHKAIDTACASRTYDGHKGTDFMIPNETSMKKGVDVLAARDGKVLRIRNGEEDRFPTAEQLAKTRADKKDCGNAVLIDHGNGWQTMSCHLKKDSIVVKMGDTVKAGDKIASVGLSGYTQFPHVHFGVTKDGKVMDPFSGKDANDDCKQVGTSLWDPISNIHYEDLAIFDAAFDTAPPTLDSLDKGRPVLKTLSAKEAGALVYHVLIGGIREGDQIRLSITAPDGKIFAERETMQDKTRARQLVFVGRKTDQILLQQGIYKAVAIIKRGDKNWRTETLIEVKS